MSEGLDGLGQVRLLLTRAISAKHERCCQNPAKATPRLAQPVERKARNLVVVGSISTVPVFQACD